MAINGTAAEFDGSDSYTDEPPPVTDWAWDFGPSTVPLDVLGAVSLSNGSGW